MNNTLLQSFFFETSLYKPIKVENEESIKLLEKIIYFNTKNSVDGYNPIQKCESTFKGTVIQKKDIDPHVSGAPSLRPPKSKELLFLENGGIFTVILKCARYDHEIYFHIFLNVERKEFFKIGQYPSIADFHIFNIKKYNKVLSKEKLKEFTRGIGLYANGVGIGAFVYLRRIFEHLIEEAYLKAKNDLSLNDNDFFIKKMHEKISILKNYLPNFLVQNKLIYPILSIGIHSLKEDECLEFFEILKHSIEQILIDKLRALEDEKDKSRLSKNLNIINSKIKKNN
jgi:hypothetical protein